MIGFPKKKSLTDVFVLSGSIEIDGLNLKNFLKIQLFLIFLI